MPPSYRLPLVDLKAVALGSNKSETYRHLLGLALRHGSKPEVVDIRELPTAMIRLSPAAKAQVDAVAEKFGMDAKAAFAGLCSAGDKLRSRELRQESVANKQIASELSLPFEPKSANQKRYYEQIQVALAGARIVFAEGSTGIGKSRAMAAAAVEQVKAGKTPVVIAAPTVAVVKHLYEEFRALGDVGAATYTVLPGASEFVDDVLLRGYLQVAAYPSSDDAAVVVDDLVRDWVNRGAKALVPSSPIAQLLGDKAAWLMDDLRQLAQNMPVEDFVLRRDLDKPDSSESRSLLAWMRDTAKHHADIIICTHAMVALGQKTQWRAMPEPCVLFVDEAHLFEQSISSVNSDQVSLLSMRAALAQECRDGAHSKGSVAWKALQQAKDVTALLQSLDTDGKRTCLSAVDAISEVQRHHAVEQLKVLQKLLASRALNGARHIERYRVAIASIVNALSKTGGHNRVDLDFSPDRRYPSLYCGPSKVDMQLRQIWNTAKGGVVLASATLYVMDSTGNNKCDYLRGILAVDFDRLSTPMPVYDRSIYTLPTIYTPTKYRQANLIPPSKSNQQSEDAWHSELAKALVEITSTAKGGTLVLMTAYRDIKALAQALGENGVAPDRLIVLSPEIKFSEAERRFRAAHAAGVRPVLLALGTAWTGIDLRDRGEPAEKDFLLTDLVITRLPIGLNRSNSMTSRVDRMGLYPVISEALLVLKQGLGRLIRRDGVQHRRIWLLDGRISPDYKWQGMETLSASVRRLVNEYTKRLEF